MDKNLLAKRVENLVCGLTKQEVESYALLAKTKEWGEVLEAGDQATEDQLAALKVAIINYPRKGGMRPFVPGYIMSDDKLLLLLVAEVTKRFFDMKKKK